MSFRRPSLIRLGLALAPLLLLAQSAPLKKFVHVAKSPDDRALIARIQALSPAVSPEDAKAVTASVVNTGQELGREWGVKWYSSMMPGIQNWLVKKGSRKGGYCYQYSMEVLVRLEALKLKTVEFHWGESGAGTISENNGIVVTALGQPFQDGVVLDSWRSQPHVAWTDAAHDPDGYRWKENKAFAALVLQRAKQTPTSSRAKGHKPVSPAQRESE